MSCNKYEVTSVVMRHNLVHLLNKFLHSIYDHIVHSWMTFLFSILTAVLTMLTNCISHFGSHTHSTFDQESFITLICHNRCQYMYIGLQSIHQESLHLTFTIPSPKRTLLSFIIQTHYLIDFIPMLFIRSIFLETLLTLFERFY